MSKAETLAYDLEAEVITHEVADKAAAELRRLDQVEAEHAALLKAISDAEPVAWMMKWPNHSPSFTTDKSDYVSWFAGKASYPDELSPLYTLNGIKK